MINARREAHRARVAPIGRVYLDRGARRRDRCSRMSLRSRDRVSHATAVARLEYTRIVYFQCAPSHARDRNTMAVSRVGFRSLNAANDFAAAVFRSAINNPGCCAWIRVNQRSLRRSAPRLARDRRASENRTRARVFDKIQARGMGRREGRRARETRGGDGHGDSIGDLGRQSPLREPNGQRSGDLRSLVVTDGQTASRRSQ